MSKETEDKDDLELYKKVVYWTAEEVCCYNAAIDKAIEVASKLDRYWPSDDDEDGEWTIPLQELTSKLQSLKK